MIGGRQPADERVGAASRAGAAGGRGRARRARATARGSAAAARSSRGTSAAKQPGGRSDEEDVACERASREVQLLDPLRAVHARQRGDDDARRVAVVEREVGAVDPQRQQRVGRRRTGRRLSVAWRSAPRGCSDSTSTLAGVRRAGAAAARSRERHAGPALGRRPALDAGDRQRASVCCGIASSSRASVELALVARRRSSSRQAAPVIAGVIRARRGGLVDREASGRPGAARREQRERAQRAADRLPGGRHAAASPSPRRRGRAGRGG